MVVTCPECGTRFALDENLIRGESAKARCSRCGHIFTVHRPAASAPAGPPPEEEIPPPPLEGEAGGPTVGEEVSPVSVAPVSPERSPPPPAPSRRWPWVVGAVLLLVLAAGAAVWRLAPRWTAWLAGPGAPPARVPVTLPPPPPAPEELKELQVELTEANFGRLEHPQAGRLLVLLGEVVNQGAKARGPVRLRAALVDAQNREVAHRLAYAGITLTEKELLSLTPAEIERRLETPGGEAVLGPRERRPFTLVFFGVPPDLAEAGYGFTVAVAEAPPASHP